MEKLEIHPAAKLFPMMNEEQFQALKADIAKNGCKEPVVTWCGQLLDGRNRYKACEELRVEPQIHELNSDEDPYAYAISLNMHRRHLSESQRAMIAAKFSQLTHGGDRRSEKAKGSNDPTINDAADKMKVGRESVKRAKSVIKNGSPELIKAVEKGEVPVSRAAKVAQSAIPKAKQLEAAKKKPAQAQKQEQSKSDDSEKLDAAEVKRICKKFRADVNRLASEFQTDVIESEAGGYFLESSQSFQDRLSNLLSYIKTGEPHCVCFQCKGDGCDSCHGCGWMSSLQARKYEQPSDIQLI